MDVVIGYVCVSPSSLPWQYTSRSRAASSRGVSRPPASSTPSTRGDGAEGGKGSWSEDGGKYRAGSSSGRGLCVCFCFFLGGGLVEDCANGWKRNPDSAASIHVSTPTHLMRARPNGSSCAS